MASVNKGKRLRELPSLVYKTRLQKVISRKVLKTGDCWLWTGSIQNNGYGSYTLYGKTTPAHRVAYFAFIGNIDSGMDVCHVCDVRNCVNPAHLYQATHKQNMRDMQSKNRGRNGVMSGNYKPIRNSAGQFLRIK
jgi:hypothetical protein